MLQIGSNEAWLWIAVESIHKQILGVYISRHRNMIVAEAFLSSLIRMYGKHIVYSDGETWYPETCVSLGLKHIPININILTDVCKQIVSHIQKKAFCSKIL